VCVNISTRTAPYWQQNGGHGWGAAACSAGLNDVRAGVLLAPVGVGATVAGGVGCSRLGAALVLLPSWQLKTAGEDVAAMCCSCIGEASIV
jgi:hypothetical protein